MLIWASRGQLRTLQGVPFQVRLQKSAFTFQNFLQGAKIQIYGLNHDVQATENGEYWRLLMPGTYMTRAQNPKNAKLSKIKKVTVTNKRPFSAQHVDFVIDE